MLLSGLKCIDKTSLTFLIHCLTNDATWHFADVAPGKYRVSTTWALDNSSRPTNAPYTVENNDGVVATVAIDQTAAPNDLLDTEGSDWEDLVAQYKKRNIPVMSYINPFLVEVESNSSFEQNYFKEANESLNFDISKLILEGPKSELDLTINTQPAIFLISYSIFHVVKDDHKINLNLGRYFAGHSLGEYSALSCAGYLNFSETLKILRKRGEAMQNAVPKGIGGMLAVLGSEIHQIEELINSNEIGIEIANDNSNGQIVVSGKLTEIDKFKEILTSKKIKNIPLPVSAPFHCKLMNKATSEMQEQITDLFLKQGKNSLISNVTALDLNDPEKIKELLIQQIESRVRWRESIIKMINDGVKKFVEIGPGKVLSGLVKRIDKSVDVMSINNIEDIKNLKIND